MANISSPSSDEFIKKNEIKLVIRSIIFSQPGRYELRFLQNDFQELEGEFIDYRKFGFPNIESFLNSLGDFAVYDYGGHRYVACSKNEKSRHIEKLVNEQRNSTKRVRFHPGTIRKPPAIKAPACWVNEMSYKNKKATDTAVAEYHRTTLGNMSEAIPDYAVKKLTEMEAYFGENYSLSLPAFELPNDVKIGSVIKIFVTEVYSPTIFFFHILSEDYIKKVLGFYDELNEFYDSNSNELDMPINLMTRENMCVAHYQGRWHRAKIVNFIRNLELPVFLVDNGTFVKIGVNQVKKLEHRFSKLPAQAVQGCLANVRSTIEGGWSAFVNQHFGNWTVERALWAKVTNIVEKKNILDLVLIDNSKGESININRKLIALGYADFE